MVPQASEMQVPEQDTRTIQIRFLPLLDNALLAVFVLF
jgi:hypothetical protein